VAELLSCNNKSQSREVLEYQPTKPRDEHRGVQENSLTVSPDYWLFVLARFRREIATERVDSCSGELPQCGPVRPLDEKVSPQHVEHNVPLHVIGIDVQVNTGHGQLILRFRYLLPI
jgi:hypothetical protein